MGPQHRWAAVEQRTGAFMTEPPLMDTDRSACIKQTADATSVDTPDLSEAVVLPLIAVVIFAPSELAATVRDRSRYQKCLEARGYTVKWGDAAQPWGAPAYSTGIPREEVQVDLEALRQVIQKEKKETPDASTSTNPD